MLSKLKFVFKKRLSFFAICKPKVDAAIARPAVQAPIMAPPEVFPDKPVIIFISLVEVEFKTPARAILLNLFVLLFQLLKARKNPCSKTNTGINHLNGSRDSDFKNLKIGSA